MPSALECQSATCPSDRRQTKFEGEGRFIYGANIGDSNAGFGPNRWLANHCFGNAHVIPKFTSTIFRHRIKTAIYGTRFADLCQAVERQQTCCHDCFLMPALSLVAIADANFA